MSFNPNEHRILIADDDASIRFFLGELLGKEGFEFDFAGTGADALECLKKNTYSLVLLDEKMPNMSGIEVLRHIKAEGYPMPVIMITAYGSKELAMRAIRDGAYDFFTKPVDIGIVRTVINRAIEKYELQRELETIKTENLKGILRDEIIAESEEMKQAVKLAMKVAATDVTALITGESGSGKELIAKAIHKLSDRKDNPFVSVNCAAIPETLLESELFGYEKGAFTGASKQHAGKFERASKGSIFLDEIGDLSPGLQAKLLRVLQNKEIERLGGTRTIKVDMRLISATNKNLDSAIRDGSFREDLLYRVRVFEIHVPPLRERIKDIPLLSDYFVKKYSRTMGRNVKGISASAIKFFLSYSWPGNVREMENLIQRAIILEDTDTVREETVKRLIFPEGIWQAQGSVSKNTGREDTAKVGNGASGVKDRIEAIKSEEERKLIIDALTEARWKRMEAAARLGISRKSLFNKMKKYGLMK
ncbi:MAG: sigma-54-dependent Fis family transcriptional regulator [Nitrospirae bacterium]|nr:sigma-54-dependent Fis family transcriptional regulator [Nitrospirota bacterium]MBI3377623.1 sigma-54-dependent Fis family transcriptional regulator [Nitrospirota bacterium]